VGPLLDYLIELLERYQDVKSVSTWQSKYQQQIKELSFKLHVDFEVRTLYMCIDELRKPSLVIWWMQNYFILLYQPPPFHEN
jgi:hypothetical protein